jgi:uncharacterized protein (TIGR00730 family)
MFKKISIFCSASDSLPSALYDLAFDLGKALAQRNFDCIYGGTDLGMMGYLVRGQRAFGPSEGKVIGIVPETIFAYAGPPDCDELIRVESMSKRKEQLLARGDAFLILPGGIGTLDEFTDVLTHKMLGLLPKPVVVVDTMGVFEGLWAWYAKAQALGLVRNNMADLFEIAHSVPEALDLIERNWD